MHVLITLDLKQFYKRWWYNNSNILIISNTFLLSNASELQLYGLKYGPDLIENKSTKDQEMPANLYLIPVLTQIHAAKWHT